VLLLALAAANLLFSPIRMPPVDQCASDRSFVAFRAELKRIVARRDSKALNAILADDVMADFDSGRGRKEFARIWKFDERKTSPIWPELEHVLGLGCSMAHGKPVIPYMAEGFPSEDDLFDKMVVVRLGAKLRDHPNEGARVIANLNEHVLEVSEESQVTGWVKAKMADGRRGYVRRNQLRSPLDYRATFEKIGGAWRMTSFVAGD